SRNWTTRVSLLGSSASNDDVGELPWQNDLPQVLSVPDAASRARASSGGPKLFRSCTCAATTAERRPFLPSNRFHLNHIRACRAGRSPGQRRLGLSAEAVRISSGEGGLSSSRSR